MSPTIWLQFVPNSFSLGAHPETHLRLTYLGLRAHLGLTLVKEGQGRIKGGSYSAPDITE